ncbi:hypothetical protein ACFZWW_001812 [Campylobacter jejuni]
MKILDLFKVKVYYFCSYKANKVDKIISGSCLVNYSRYFWKKTDFEMIKNKIVGNIISPALRQGNSKNEPNPFISEK